MIHEKWQTCSLVFEIRTFTEMKSHFLQASVPILKLEKWSTCCRLCIEEEGKDEAEKVLFDRWHDQDLDGLHISCSSSRICLWFPASDIVRILSKNDVALSPATGAIGR